MASETSAIALRSEEITKGMPIATASGGGVANLSHDLFFILLYNITIFLCSEICFIVGLSRKLNYIAIERALLKESIFSSGFIEEWLGVRNKQIAWIAKRFSDDLLFRIPSLSPWNQEKDTHTFLIFTILPKRNVTSWWRVFIFKLWQKSAKMCYFSMWLLKTDL